MVQLPHLVRLVYIALWNAADDHGYIKDEPERLAMELMPKEAFEDVDSAIQLLAAAERLEWFVDEDGASYYRVAHWEDHQRVDHPGKSKILRESSRKVSIPTGVRRSVAEKYGCAPGECKDASCFYCGMPGKVHWSKLYDGRPSAWVTFPGLELDHLESEDEGGVTSSENIVLACRRCNRSKGTKHWFDFISSLKFANHREMSRKLALEQGTGNREQGKENTPLTPQGGNGKRDRKPTWTKAHPEEVIKATQEIKAIWPRPEDDAFQPDGKTLVPGVSPSELASRLAEIKALGAELDICVKVAARVVSEWKAGKWIKAPQHFFGKAKDSPFRAYYQAYVTNEAVRMAS